MPTLQRYPLRIQFGVETRVASDQLSALGMWRGNDVQIDAAVLFKGQPLDLSNVVLLRLQLKDKQSPVSGSLAEVTASVSLGEITPVISLEGWVAGNQQHASFVFSSAQTAQDLHDAVTRQFWLVLSGVTDTGKVITYGAVVVTINEDNAGDNTTPPTPAEQYYTQDEVDQMLFAHASRTDNPHAVTKAQVGLGNADNTSDANKPVSIAQQAALTAHTSRTDNPHAVTKAQVGLGNADNTSDANKPISTAAAAALALKAPLASPALTGTPTAPTPANTENSTRIATTAYVKALINELVNSSPAALDTFFEFANAINNDPNYATTVATQIATKLTKDQNLNDLPNKPQARLNLGIDLSVTAAVGKVPQADANGKLDPSWLPVGGVGGGESASGSVVLTATSKPLQAVTSTAYGQSVTLPDATLLTVNPSKFTIHNRGGYHLAIKNNAGVTKGFLEPGEATVVDLVSNATAAGVWLLSNVVPYGTTKRLFFDAGSDINWSGVNVVSLGTKLLYLRTNMQLNAFVVDAANGTRGAINTFGGTYGINGMIGVDVIGSSKVLLSYYEGRYVRYAIITVSGTSLSIAAVTHDLTGNSVQYRGGGTIKISSTLYVGFFYWNDTDSSAYYARMFPIDVTGATPVLGTAYTWTSRQVEKFSWAYSESKLWMVQAYGPSGGWQIRAQLFSVTASSFTAGTEIYIDSNSDDVGWIGNGMWRVNTGRFVFCYRNSVPVAVLLTNTSGLELSHMKLTSGLYDTSVTAMYPMGTNRMIAGSSNQIQALTDTNGTLSVASVAFPALPGSSSTSVSLSLLRVDGTNVLYEITTDSGYRAFMWLDWSGASPVITFYDGIMAPSSVSITRGFVTPSDFLAQVSKFVLSDGSILPLPSSYYPTVVRLGSDGSRRLLQTGIVPMVTNSPLAADVPLARWFAAYGSGNLRCIAVDRVECADL